MEIGLMYALMSVGLVFIGYMAGVIMTNNSMITIEDLNRAYDTGYKFGYNDALDDVEHDLNVDLKEYRDS